MSERRRQFEMNERSKQVRRDIIKLSLANGGYHFGGTFSCVEILITLFDQILDGDDRFILSKGHACWGYYVLLMERGFKPALEGHPHLDLANGVHWTTGSEGHGLPAGVGMALARKMQKRGGKVYVVIGDGECQEGTTWESMLMAVQHKLNNLVVIIDFNKTQGSGFTKDILKVDCMHRVANEIGWIATDVDGHDVDKLARTLSQEYEYPHLIIADTVKGKGVSFMEGQPGWHARWPNKDEVAAMLKELA
jgi:transketolase